MKPIWHRGDYDVRSRRVVARAQANPNTRCWRCGKTLREHRPHRTGRRAFWTAGHVRDSDRTSPLLPEASTCNFRAGAKLGAARRAARNGNPTSRRWFE